MDSPIPGTSKREQSGKADVVNEIENLLLVHEKKSNVAPIAGITNPEESESSDSDAETSKPTGASAGEYVLLCCNLNLYHSMGFSRRHIDDI